MTVDAPRGGRDAWEHARHAVVLLLPYTLTAVPGLGAVRLVLILVAVGVAPVVAVRARRAMEAAGVEGAERRPYLVAIALACLVPVPAVVTLAVWRTIDPGSLV